MGSPGAHYFWFRERKSEGVNNNHIQYPFIDNLPEVRLCSKRYYGYDNVYVR